MSQPDSSTLKSTPPPTYPGFADKAAYDTWFVEFSKKNEEGFLASGPGGKIMDINVCPISISVVCLCHLVHRAFLPPFCYLF